LEAILLGRGEERVFRVSGIIAVNRAREAYYVGGERKSDSGDARVIADQLRFRRWRFLPEIRPADERLAEIDAGTRLSPAGPGPGQRSPHRPAQGAPFGSVPRPGGRAGPQQAGSAAGGEQGGHPVRRPQARRSPSFALALKAKGVLRKADELARRIVSAAKAQSGASCPPRRPRLL
jgi:hypothetical protein